MTAPPNRRALLAAAAAAAASLAGPGPPRAAASERMPAAWMPAAAATPRRPHGRLALPDVPLSATDGRTLRFASEVLAGRLVALDVVFADCSTVCPISSRIMRAAQGALPAELAARARFVSLTFDPEADTPARLAAYAAAVAPAPTPEWLWLTGEPRAVRQVLARLRAVAGGDPNNHAPVFYAGDAATGRFVEFFGLPTAEEVVEVLQAAAGTALGHGTAK